MIKAVIFDLDGTMIDSEDASFLAWQGCARQLDQSFTIADFHLVLGVRIDESLANMLAHWQVDVTPMQMRDLMKDEWDAAKQAIKKIPGVDALHSELARRRLPWGCATASHLDYTEEMLQRFDLMEACAAIATGSDVENTKPAPDIYLLCAERMGVDPAHCIAIEDSVPGHQAAANAGMRVVAIPGPFNQPEEYGAADYIFPDLATFHANLDTVLATSNSKGAIYCAPTTP